MWIFLFVLSSASAAPNGAALYASRCQSCHGVSGGGDGPVAKALPGKIPSLSSVEFWKNKTDASIARVISSGRPGTAMRGFKLSPDQMSSLITHLKTFKPSKTSPQ